MLLIEIDGSDAEQVEGDYDAVGQLCLDRGAVEVYVADNHTTRERIWKIRRNIAEAFKVISPVQSLEDIVVPTAAIPALMPEVERLSRSFGVTIPSYGHAGDGNLHATPVMNPAWTLDRWRRTLPKILADLYRLTGSLGGTISGEHGIGHKRKAYMPLVMPAETLDLMRAIKRAWDPSNILNPGKVFDA